MSISSSNEMNQRIINISKAISSLFVGGSSSDETVSRRDEALRIVADQSEVARRKLSRTSNRR